MIDVISLCQYVTYVCNSMSCTTLLIKLKTVHFDACVCLHININQYDSWIIWFYDDMIWNSMFYDFYDFYVCIVHLWHCNGTSGCRVVAQYRRHWILQIPVQRAECRCNFLGCGSGCFAQACYTQIATDSTQPNQPHCADLQKSEKEVK